MDGRRRRVTIIVDYRALNRQCMTLEVLYERMVEGMHIGDEADDLMAAITLLRGYLQRTTLPRRNEPTRGLSPQSWGADIYLYDKRREDLDARISAWINEPKHQGIMSRLGLSPDEERSMVHIWRGGIDKESKALAKEFEALQETHYFRDSYNASSLFWVLGLSWWQLARNDVIDDDDVMSAIDVQLLLQHYYEVRGDRLSDDAIEKWYAGEMEKGMIF